MKNIIFMLSLALFCCSAWAVNGDMGGTDPNGSEEFPYLIEDLADFDEFAGNSAYWASGVHTKLMTDIDLSGRTYTDAAPIQTFSGNFDGQNHIIFNLTVTGSRQCGLFGSVDGTSLKSAIVKNIILHKCNITSDAAYNGCLIGWARWYVTVQNCHIKQSQITSPYALIGGLIGLAGNTSVVTPDVMVSMCSVVDSNVSGGNLVGGLIGATAKINIQSCYVDCSVQSSGSSIGGLVGGNDPVVSSSITSTISDCYSTATVTGNAEVGGLVGRNFGTVMNSYAIGRVVGSSDHIGGLIGIMDGVCESCFWDINTSGMTKGIGNEVPDPAGVMGKTTSEMMTQGTFTDWDFDPDDGDPPNWMMLRELEDYPRLTWQEIFAGDIAGLYGADIVDFALLASQWKEPTCIELNNWCQGADIDHLDGVDIKDLLAVANDWLQRI